MEDEEKVLKGLECLSDENNICSKNTCPYNMFESCVPEISHDALNLLKEQQEIIDELNAAIKEWRNLKWFTPYEVGIAMVTHGQKDPQFKWGETIRYSPAEVEKILNEVGKNEN